MPALKKTSRNPEPIYISKDAITMGWFFLNVAVLLYTAWYVKDISSSIHPRRKYVIMGRMDQRRSPDVMTDETLLVRMQEEVRTITESVFNRSPIGLDRQDSARRFFTPSAWAAVSAQIDEENTLFKDNRIHQKAEIGGVSIEDITPEEAAADAAADKDRDKSKPATTTAPEGPPNRLVTTTGQLIRIGTMTKKGSNYAKLFHEVWEFRLTLKFESNGRLNANGVYPWTCRDLQMTRRLASSDRPLTLEHS